jgi:hypothetical protein
MSNNLTGVHNYCSRWCERCPFPDRCSAFELSQQFAKVSDLDLKPNVPTALPAMSRPFSSYWPVLKQCLAENGQDWLTNAYGIDEQHPTVSSGLDIKSTRKLSAQVVLDLFVICNQNSLAWVKRDEEFQTDCGQGTASLRWYGPMVGPKFARVLPSAEDLEFGVDESGKSPTVKLLHLILARSIAGATLTLEAYPNAAVQLLPLVVKYCRLLNYLRIRYPEAHSLQRTVFDNPRYTDEISKFYNHQLCVDPFRDNSWSLGGRAPSEYN